MSRLDELISGQFRRLEQRGRGWQVWPEPVAPEPPFQPFTGYTIPQTSPDDGRIKTTLGSLLDSIERTISPKPPPLPPPPETPEPSPIALSRGELDEIQILLPSHLSIDEKSFRGWLAQISHCSEPLAFEILGTSERIVPQLAMHPSDTSYVRRQLRAHFPEIAFVDQQDTLLKTWRDGADEAAVVEFGLSREFAFTLETKGIDPFVGLVGAMSELQAREAALFQVLFQPARHPWGEQLERASMAVGQSIFANLPDWPKRLQEKFSSPLFAAVVRIAVFADDFDRAWELACDMAGAFRAFSRFGGNELIPLRNDDYPFADHVEDVLLRQSRRSGMLLNTDELLRFVHFPTEDVDSPRLLRNTGRTKPAPASVTDARGVLLGYNLHIGRETEVRLTPEQRVRHTHLIGASGTGKSTLLLNLIQQDIENGEGLAVLDPHGDLIDRILGSLPEHRLHDVVLVDPSDEDFSVGFNILLAHSDLEKNLLSSDLVSVFQRLSTSWGDQMNSVLQNAILAFLESSRGGTLADLRRFLIDTAYRNDFLATVNDPDVVFYWKRSFPQLTGNKSIGPVLTRLETFLSPKPIRYMVSQSENRLDFASVMDSGKIFLAKLSQGQIGKENAFLLGSLLVTKFQQAAMSRQRMAHHARKDFWFYIDEFHHFITPSMTEILTGARKYRLGLILAHQELRQLQRDSEVAAAVLSNCHTRVVFRVGDADARVLQDGFANFKAQDLQNLGTGEAVARVERSDADFNLVVRLPNEPDADRAAFIRNRAITASREKYAKPRAMVEAELRAKLESFVAEPLPTKPKPKPSPLPNPSETEAVPRPAEIPKQEVQTKNAGAQESGTQPAAPTTIENPNEPEALQPVPLGTVEKESKPRDLGRGGEQHRAIQERLQSESHALGFLATIESQLGKQSNQAADLVLKRGPVSIAVEITITTTTDHEFGNVKKCLAAGFTRVAVVSPKLESLRAIAIAVQAGLGSEAAAQVSYHTPDELIAELRTLAQAQVEQAPPALPKERISRGFKVRRHGPELSEAERKSKEELAIKIMAQTMQQKSELHFFSSRKTGPTIL